MLPAQDDQDDHARTPLLITLGRRYENRVFIGLSDARRRGVKDEQPA
jgi:hypothetical protein